VAFQWHFLSASKYKKLTKNAPRRTRAVFGAFILVGALTVALPAALPTSAAQAATCGAGAGHYYGAATSGTSNYGTEAQIWTWNKWSVNKDNAQDFSDEGVWSIDDNNRNDALEVGFFSGYGAGNINGASGWTNGMVPYYTLNNGGKEYDEWGTFLPSDTYIWMFAQADGSNSFAYVNGQLNTSMNYTVNQPRLSYTQGEVYDNDNVWMGGGTGDSSTLYWLNSAGAANHWAYLTTCDNSPYWASSSNGTYFFANGGY
jgi:hypothetical protein